MHEELQVARSRRRDAESVQTLGRAERNRRRQLDVPLAGHPFDVLLLKPPLAADRDHEMAARR